MGEVLKIYIPQAENEDKKIWQFTKEGHVLTRSASNILIKGYHNQANTNNLSHWKKHWKINLPPKILMFGWKCINNGIVVNVLCNSKVREVDKICPLCKSYDETIEHALFHCEHARATWFSCPFGIISHKVPNNGLVEWWKNIIAPSNLFRNICEEVKAWTIVTWWTIWKACNDSIGD